MSAAAQTLLIDAEARHLFAVFHPANAIARAGVLFCPPFLHEHALSYRMFAVLGDALATHGVAALRFDYHGTGDSAGDDCALSLDGAIGDAALALDALRQRVGAAPLIVLGVRAGAWVAAALANRRDVSGLWLWQPVLDGAVHLRELHARDLAERRSTMRYPRGGGERSVPGTQTLIGFPCSTALSEQIGRARLQPAAGWPPLTVLDRASRAPAFESARQVVLAAGLGEWADRIDIDHFPLLAVRELAARLAASPEIA